MADEEDNPAGLSLCLELPNKDHGGLQDEPAGSFDFATTDVDAIGT